MRGSEIRRGLSAVEMIVGLLLVAVVSACLLIAVPRARERSRRAGCQSNLHQVGLALGTYHLVAGHWPSAALDGESPITAMLNTLGQPDFATLRNPKVPPPRRLAGPATEHIIPGLVCPTDRNAFTGRFPAPVNYRANTGDTTDGQGGPFALGRTVSLDEVEAADGAAFTAAVSERLLGAGSNRVAAPWAYAIVPFQVGDEGCPAAPPRAFRGDAGASWLVADWRSTLYGHMALPNGAGCVADDGGTASLSASSDHGDGVHVLLLDGSLRTVVRSVAPAVWRALGTIGGPRP